MSDYGPSNAVMGDNSNYGLDLVDTAGEGIDLTETAKKARFSKTAEFKELKEFVEGRIKYYERFFPSANGMDVAVRDMPNEERGWRWLAADCITHEFSSLIAKYESAAEEMKEVRQREATR